VTAAAASQVAAAGGETAATEPGPSRRAKGIEYGYVGVLALAAFAFYLVYSLSRYDTYLSSGYDLGIFDQAVRAYAHFHAPIVPLKGASYNVLGDHFHPIIALIAPLYWIWDSPCTLLIVQSALIAGSIPVIYRFARRRTGSWMALLISGAYSIGWAFQAMIDFDFHEVAFGVPLIALAIDALDRRADRSLLIYCGLLLLVREDMGALLAMLGIIRFLVGRRTEPRSSTWPGLALIAVGIAGYFIATDLVIPHFAPDGKFNYWSYQTLGPNLPAALGDIVIRPWHAARVFFTPWVKTQTMLYLFVPLAFLPLRSRYVLVALPLLAERFFNSRDVLWSTHFHYNAMPWVVLTLAAIDGGARLHVFSWRPARYVFAGWLIVVPFWIAQWDTVTPNAIDRLINQHAFERTPEVRASQKLTSLVPDDVCVAVDDRLAPHLTRRDYVTLADAQYGTADYVALDFKYPDVGNFGPSPAYVYSHFVADGYRVIFNEDKVVLLQSPHYSGPSAACKPFGPGKS
jgi:uncharacterized membrane protein